MCGSFKSVFAASARGELCLRMALGNLMAEV